MIIASLTNDETAACGSFGVLSASFLNGTQIVNDNTLAIKFDSTNNQFSVYTTDINHEGNFSIQVTATMTLKPVTRYLSFYLYIQQMC